MPNKPSLFLKLFQTHPIPSTSFIITDTLFHKGKWQIPPTPATHWCLAIVHQLSTLSQTIPSSHLLSITNLAFHPLVPPSYYQSFLMSHSPTQPSIHLPIHSSFSPISPFSPPWSPLTPSLCPPSSQPFAQPSSLPPIHPPISRHPSSRPITHLFFIQFTHLFLHPHVKYLLANDTNIFSWCREVK